jgi:hypothetical protein
MLPFLPPKVQHVIHMLLACAIAVFVVLKSDPTLGALPWVVAIGTVLTVLNTVFTSTPGDAKKIENLQGRVTSLLTKMGPPLAVLLFALSQSACAQAIPVIGPTISCVSTIVADALKGETLEQILQDAGPGCVTSIDQIIAILVGEAQRNPMVRETAAYKDQRVGAYLRASP